MKKALLFISVFAIFSLYCETTDQNLVMRANIPEKMKKIVSVMKFEDRSIGTKEFESLRMGIPDMIMQALGRVPYFKIISQEYLVKYVIKQQEFQLLGMTDPGSAVKLGKILNAQYMVIGSFQVFKNTMNVNAKVISVETGEIVAQTSSFGPVDDFYILQNKVAISLTEDLKVNLTDDAKQKLLNTYETKKFNASIANYKGESILLDIEIKKQQEEARLKEELKKKEEEKRLAEKLRKEEEARKKIEEEKLREKERLLTEMRRKEEELRRKAEEDKKKLLEAKMLEERRLAEEKRMLEEKKKAEEALKKALEEERRLAEERRIMELRKKELEMKLKEEQKLAEMEAKRNFKEAVDLDSNYQRAKRNLSKLAQGIPMTL